MTLLEAQSEAIGLASPQLAYNVLQCGLKSFRPVKDIIDDDLCVNATTDCESFVGCACFPNAIDVVNHGDEGGRSVCWAKWHDGVCPLDRVRALEC